MLLVGRARMRHAAATAVLGPQVLSDRFLRLQLRACAASCFVARVRASREEKAASPISISAESHVAVYMPVARKEAI
jgi:hypothetical protein